MIGAALVRVDRFNGFTLVCPIVPHGGVPDILQTSQDAHRSLKIGIGAFRNVQQSKDQMTGRGQDADGGGRAATDLGALSAEIKQQISR
ncbi:hypothetical protein [Roseibium sp. Sym1]|uniref:hypothetical protein n=1 Tax=Roseibium sp. Sym1 TaxID=3016006 RepID=UPI0022B4A45F|nr:hypothetical protein [Roseibium sp. Sym1]